MATFLGKSDAGRELPLFFRRPPDRDWWKGIKNLPDLAVRHGKWKLLCDYDGSKPLLFDIPSDHGEAKNLASEQPEVVGRLTKLVLAWHEELPPDNGPELE